MGFLFVALFCHWAPHFSSQLNYHFLMTWFLCEPGVAMVPINWQEMQCPVTLQKEFRKVAKVCWLFPILPKSSDMSWLFKLNHSALRTIAGVSWSMILIFWPLQEHCWFLEEAASDTWSFSDVRVMKGWILSNLYSKVGVTTAHGLWAHLETKYKMLVYMFYIFVKTGQI